MNIPRLLLLLATFTCAALPVRAASPEAMLRGINRGGLTAPVVLASQPLAGHYARNAHLTGDDLYLFPDGRFLYIEWGCLEPRTIHDRGQWSAKNGIVDLKPDGTIPRKYGLRDLRCLTLESSAAPAGPPRLMGFGWDYKYFRAHAKGSGGSGPDFMLTLCSKTRGETIDPAGAEALYKKLMQESWRPKYFEN